MIAFNNKNILIYANGTPKTGGGHILRQLALAQAAKIKGFIVTFIYQQCEPSLELRLKDENFSTYPLNNESIADAIKILAADIVIIDDYHLKKQEKNLLKQSQVPIIVFDDQTDSEQIIADIIINSAESITIEDYQQRTDKAQFYLGSDFRLIRQEFVAQRQKLPIFAERKRILISLGASDVKQLTYPLIDKLLTQHSKLPLDIIIGGMAPVDEVTLREKVLHHPNTVIHKSVKDMSVLMVKAGLAITAAGGTLFELASLGVPSIALCVADNQLPALYSPLSNNGYLAVDFREYSNESNVVSMLLPLVDQCLELWQKEDLRLSMSEFLKQQIDGLGSQRIITIIEQLLINDHRSSKTE